jgi:hypothetical protein
MLAAAQQFSATLDTSSPAVLGAILLTTIATLLYGFNILPVVLHNITGYVKFLSAHEEFYRDVAKTKRRILPFKLPWPGSFPIQYFLLEPPLAKAMFASSPALDHRNSIDMMHEQVWAIPSAQSKEFKTYEVTRAADKHTHRVLAKGNLQETMTRYENHVSCHASFVSNRWIGELMNGMPLVALLLSPLTTGSP